MQSTLMLGLVFVCLLQGGENNGEFDIRQFAGIWYHTGEVVNGSLQNELDSVTIKAKIESSGGILVNIHRVRNEQCEQDVIFLEATDNAQLFESIRISKVQIVEANFDRYCVIHVAALNFESTFIHLFTREPTPSDNDMIHFEFYVGMMGFDFKQIVYLSRTDQCPW